MFEICYRQITILNDIHPNNKIVVFAIKFRRQNICDNISRRKSDMDKKSPFVFNTCVNSRDLRLTDRD